MEEKVSALYGDLFNDFREEDFIKYKNLGIKILKRVRLKNKVCLDAGCGIGFLSGEIAKKAKKVYAVDISKKNIENAKKYNKEKNIVFKRASLLELPYKNNFFDLTISDGVVCITKDFQKALDEVCRVSKEVLISFYRKKGLKTKIIDFVRTINFFPYEAMKSLLFFLSPLSRYYVLDYLYTPILRRVSIKQTVKEFEKRGFKKKKVFFLREHWFYRDFYFYHGKKQN